MHPPLLPDVLRLLPSKCLSSLPALLRLIPNAWFCPAALSIIDVSQDLRAGQLPEHSEDTNPRVMCAAIKFTHVYI